MKTIELTVEVPTDEEANELALHLYTAMHEWEQIQGASVPHQVVIEEDLH